MIVMYEIPPALCACVRAYKEKTKLEKLNFCLFSIRDYHIFKRQCFVSTLINYTYHEKRIQTSK